MQTGLLPTSAAVLHPDMHRIRYSKSVRLQVSPHTGGIPALQQASLPARVSDAQQALRSACRKEYRTARRIRFLRISVLHIPDSCQQLPAAAVLLQTEVQPAVSLRSQSRISDRIQLPDAADVRSSDTSSSAYISCTDYHSNPSLHSESSRLFYILSQYHSNVNVMTCYSTLCDMTS